MSPTAPRERRSPRTRPPAAGTQGPPAEPLRIPVSSAVGEVSGLWVRPEDARLALALAHGAGAGMTHVFMQRLAARLAARGTATLRYQFPYVERGRGVPDPPGVLTATVRAAARAAVERAKGLPVLAGGKSMGGRMTTTAAADAPLEGVRGIALFGFPLHAPGRPGLGREAHLAGVGVPMLFLQGTRDTLADIALMRSVAGALGPAATLHVIDGADHSFKLPARAGRTEEDVLDEIASTFEAWATRVTG